jgi:hypothetical protein
MALTFPNSGTYLPTATGTVSTLFTDATAGLKQFRINLANLPAGTVLQLSLQSLDTSSGSYWETEGIALSNSIAVPASPAIGYQPDWISEWVTVSYGFQVQAQIVSGTLPSTGLGWSEASVS